MKTRGSRKHERRTENIILQDETDLRTTGTSETKLPAKNHEALERIKEDPKGQNSNDKSSSLNNPLAKGR